MVITLAIQGKVKSDKKLSCWSGNQGVVYIGNWFELPGDGKEHEVKLTVDEPNKEKYVFRFGNIIERYKEFTENESITEAPEENAENGRNHWRDAEYDQRFVDHLYVDYHDCAAAVCQHYEPLEISSRKGGDLYFLAAGYLW